MRLVGYNTQFSRGRDGRIDIDRMVAAVHEADIIALQEIERHWLRSAEADQPAEIAARLPKHHWVYGPYFDVDASKVAGDGTVTNRRRQFGVMTLSRWPILSSRLHILPKFKTATVFNMVAGFLETVIDAPGGPLRHYNVHLCDVTPDERLAQIARIFDVVWSAPKEGGAPRAFQSAAETTTGAGLIWGRRFGGSAANHRFAPAWSNGDRSHWPRSACGFPPRPIP